MRRAILPVSALLAAAPLFLANAENHQGCTDLREDNSTAVITGVLTVQIFAGPPNYASVADGDIEEKALILELPRPMCADDGEFIRSTTQFDRVHVSSSIPRLLDVLNMAIGRNVTVQGEAFGAHTGHHRAPLVLLADEVTVR
jgi:hypothetical protein